jgi:hypothetical protein
VRFSITNQTSSRLDSVCILPDKNSGRNFISLAPHETRDFFTDMGNSVTDGAYQITYKTGNTIRKDNFGYYSNGISMEKLTKIFIQPDTIAYDFIY